MKNPNLFQRVLSAVKKEKKEPMSSISEVERLIEASGNWQYNHIFSWSYDGEKNLGEIGPIKEYFPDYQLLSLRSWQSYLESEITQTVLNKFSKWIIGSGLKLQSEPNNFVLENEGITFDTVDFSKTVESYFNIFAKSRKASYNNMSNLNELANTAFLNAKIGGNVLVILRLVKGKVKVELIDGQHLFSPNGFGTDYSPQVLKNGNTIKNGVEFNSRGEQVAFHVQTRNLEFKRIPAKSTKTGLTTAFLIGGLKYRLDSSLAMPLISVVLETLKKLERYKEATVGSAEERQKIAFFIEHGQMSTGENPLLNQMAKAMDLDQNNEQLPKDINAKQLADNIAATTNKETFNMPVDSTLKMLESKNELYFKDFYSTNINLVCAALGIPPEVALSKYDSNFSASRAALKDWEHTILVERQSFTDSFYQKIYEFWFEVLILQNKISAPGYLTARAEKNDDVVNAYLNSRFIGASVPHIDPEKEARAERVKLGSLFENYPLTTVEKSTESLNGGDSSQNIKQAEKDLEELDKLQPEEPPPPPPPPE